jgi:Co/Zn/Cd efflux system component
MRAVFLHVLADAFGSMVVITSALLNKYNEKLHISSDIIHYVDPCLW